MKQKRTEKQQKEREAEKRNEAKQREAEKISTQGQRRSSGRKGTMVEENKQQRECQRKEGKRGKE